MGFQILNNNQPLTMDELDNEAAAFWGVENSDKHYVAPKGYDWPSTWFEFIGNAIAQLPEGKLEWTNVIGKLCSIASLGETSYESIISFISGYKPFIELCLNWKAKGYVPISFK